MFRSCDHHQGAALFLAKITLLKIFTDYVSIMRSSTGTALFLAKITLLKTFTDYVSIMRSSSGSCAVPC